MTDLQTRFRTLDNLSAPNLWYDIEERAVAIQPARRRTTWVLVAAMLLLALAIGGAVLIGSGILKLPVTVEATATPTATAEGSPVATATPVEPVAATWTATGDMIEARVNHTATQLQDGRVLVTGGVGTATSEFFANILASAELYDPSTGRWTATGSMLGIRVGHTATLLPDGRVLVVGGGSSSDGNAGPLATAELYDPNTGTWTATRNTIGAGPGRTATLLDSGEVLLTGGVGENLETLAIAELYDPATDSWSATGDMADARSGHRATLLLDGKVLVVGGGLASAELYDPATAQWAATGDTSGILVGHTAARLSDGTVIVAGGMAGTGASSVAQLYDPSTGEWTGTGDMVEARTGYQATLLPNGTVLAAGGSSSVVDPVPVASAELYGPDAGTWVATETMAAARTGHTATLLANGAVLVAGGNDTNGSLASAELYVPGT
jgi:N-acetylneuraminic acid mutarotase